MTNHEEETVFHEARRISCPQQRDTYLRRVCSGDDALRERLNTLLRAYEEAPGFLEAGPPVPGLTSNRKLSESTEEADDAIDNYQLYELLGEGGFASVYRAQQLKPIRRIVAVKILKLGMDTRQIVARFELESQALAAMDHPAIATVFDAGATDKGRPYFAMEYVDGQSITSFCDQATLSIEQRLQLFRQVCQGVQHAHQKGVIHRDLKPANILVATTNGTPLVKIIDFGVAKALQSQNDCDPLTGESCVNLGTPQYMSPEQANGQGADVDTRSDVFSLGVTLFELLTGQTPLTREELRGTDPTAVSQLIQDHDAPTPSTRMRDSCLSNAQTARRGGGSPAPLYKQIRGDIDWIVLKALEKDRSRRYQTVEGLARDIQRHLSDEPVQARPASTLYRMRKFARKHRIAVIGSTIALLTLITVLVLATFSLSRINHERQVAAMANDQARELIQIVQHIVQDLIVPDSNSRYQQSRGGETATDLLVKVKPIYQRIEELSAGDPQIRLELSQLQRRIGRQLNAVGGDGISTLQGSVTELESLVAEFPDNSPFRSELATSYASLAQGHIMALRWIEVERCERLSTDQVQYLSEHFPAAGFETRLAKRQSAWASSLYRIGQLASAEDLFCEALPKFNSSDNQYRFVWSRQMLANLRMDQGRFDDAAMRLKEALESYAEMHDQGDAPPSSGNGQHPNSTYVHLLKEKGKLSHYAHQLDEAQLQLTHVVDLGQALTDNWRSTNSELTLASARMYLSENFLLQSKFEQAKLYLGESLKIEERGKGNWASFLAGQGHCRLGELMWVQGDYAEARVEFDEAIRQLEVLVASLPGELRVQTRLSVLLSNCADPKLRDPSRAAELAASVITESNGPLWRYLALAQYRQGNVGDAVNSVNQAMELHQNGGDALDRLLLALSLKRAGQDQEALKRYEEAEAAIADGTPVYYDEIGVLGFRRLRAEAKAVFELSSEAIGK